jgi:hypothetical protein
MIALFIGAAWFTWAALRGSYLAWQGAVARHWPRTRGRIVASRVVTTRAFRGGPIRMTLVHYHYEVSGRSYRGTMVRWTDPIDGDAHWKRTVAAYPRGQAVHVAYDPREPARAVLEVGVPWQAWTTVLLAFAFTTGSWWLLFQVW